MKKIYISHKLVDKIFMFFIFLLTSFYVYLYSLELNFSSNLMKVIFLIIFIFVIPLSTEYTLYSLFFFLPLRKSLYFGPLAFFNIILLIILIKYFLFSKKLSIKPFFITFIIAVYDIMISLITYPDYSLSLYMIKWYISLLIFLILIEGKFNFFDYKKMVVFLNMGLFIVGCLTISQYLQYDIIDNNIRDQIAGAGGMLDQNTFSFFCLMGSGSIISLLLDKNSRIEGTIDKVFLVFLGLFNFISGMFMVSKAFYLVVTITFIITIIYMFIKKQIKFIHIVFFFSIIFLFIFTPRFSSLLDSLLNRLDGSTNLNDVSTGRFDIYSFYIISFFEKPLNLIFGAGLSTYNLYYGYYRNYVTHNTILEIIAAWGILGLIFICTIFYNSIKKYRVKKYKTNLYSLIPIIIIALFSQTLSMFWEDSSLFFFLYALLICFHYRKGGCNYYVKKNNY